MRGSRAVRGRRAVSSPYHYTTWLRERGREGDCVPSPWVALLAGQQLSKSLLGVRYASCGALSRALSYRYSPVGALLKRVTYGGALKRYCNEKFKG